MFNVSMSPYYTHSHQTSTTQHTAEGKIHWPLLCMCPAHPVHNSSELILCVDNAVDVNIFSLPFFCSLFFKWYKSTCTIRCGCCRSSSAGYMVRTTMMSWSIGRPIVLRSKEPKSLGDSGRFFLFRLWFGRAVL